MEIGEMVKVNIKLEGTIVKDEGLRHLDYYILGEDDKKGYPQYKYFKSYWAPFVGKKVKVTIIIEEI